MESSVDPKWGSYSPLHDPRILANFETRPSDILITTAPKAGTTWMQQILYQIKSRGDPDFDYIDNVVPWLELAHTSRSWQESLEKYKQLESPRVFKTHCTYHQTPNPDSVSIILTSRDPRDCCVSFYHHLLSMNEAALEQMDITVPDSFDEYFENWMSFGSWYRNVSSWWPHINDSNVLWLRYEDMVKDLNGAVENIISFLNWSITESEKEKVLNYSSFAWMKKHNDKFAARFDDGKPMFKTGGFIRKGKVGDHKNLLTPEHEARILERAMEELPAQCLEFLGLN